MSRFYSDFMKDHDDFFIFDFVSDKLFELKVKSSRKDDKDRKITVEQRVAFTDSGDEAKGHNIDTEVKIKKALSKGSFELKLTPSKIKVEKKCTPDIVNDGDREGSFLGRVEHKVGKDYTDITAGFTYGLPKLADNASLWLEGNLVSNNLKTYAGDLSAVVALNKQYYIGTKVVADLQAQKLQEAHGFIAAYFDKNFAYLMSNCLERKVRLGFCIPQIQFFDTLAAETHLELDEKYALKGNPTTHVAFDHRINSDSKIKAKFDISKEIFAHFSFVHNINQNLQLTLTDFCNPLGFFRDAGETPYKFGIALEANL